MANISYAVMCFLFRRTTFVSVPLFDKHVQVFLKQRVVGFISIIDGQK